MLLGAFKLLHFRSFPCGNVLATNRCGLDESFAKERDVMRRHRIELEKPIAKFDKRLCSTSCREDCQYSPRSIA